MVKLGKNYYLFQKMMMKILETTLQTSVMWKLR